MGNSKSDKGKRALLSYIVTPFILRSDDWRNIQFSNIGIAKNIVNILNKLGYTVDVIEYADKKFIPTKDYEIFIGHGGFNFQNIAEKLSPKTKKIYLSAGPYWRYWNRKEIERVDSFRKRRKVDYPYERLDTSEEWACTNANAIIALGNKIVAESYKKFPHTYTLNNAAYRDQHFIQTSKNYKNARNSFLFFAGGGNVHKGLDLLLEAFSKLSSHLYICQSVDPDFYKIYNHELKDYSNIHLIGHVQMRSQQFYDLVNKCAYLIYPSCADGSPGAVVECMHQGLIPVLSSDATVNVDRNGFLIKKISVEEMVDIVNRLTRLSPKVCQNLSERTYQIAVREYSETKFLNNLHIILRKILNSN